MKYPTKIDPVTADEIRNDKRLEMANEVNEARWDTELDNLLDQMANGQWDSDIAEHLFRRLDPSQVGKIIRNLVEAYRTGDFPLYISRIKADIESADIAIEDFAHEMVQNWMES